MVCEYPLQPPEHLDGVDDAHVRVAEVVEPAQGEGGQQPDQAANKVSIEKILIVSTLTKPFLPWFYKTQVTILINYGKQSEFRVNRRCFRRTVQYFTVPDTYATQMLGMVVLPPNKTGLMTHCYRLPRCWCYCCSPDVVHDDCLNSPVGVEHGQGAEQGVRGRGGVQEWQDHRGNLVSGVWCVQ